MKNFGTELDIKNLISEDGFYCSLSEFKKFILFVLNQYLIEENSFKIIYNPKNGEFIKDENYKSSYKKYVMDKINLKKIGFCNAGFAYIEDDKELAIVSPEYFMIHFLKCVKRNSAMLYSAYQLYQEKYGNEFVNNLSFKNIHNNLYNEYRKKSKESGGLYRLTEDYSESYLRSILLLDQIETTIDNVGDNILDYFCDGFDEWNDENYRKVEDQIERKLNDNPRNDVRVVENGVVVTYIDQDYLKLEDEMNDLKRQEATNALNRYRKKFAENQKIACSELIRILENKFKEIVVCYSYQDSENKRGYITNLGIDEVLYYSHPKDKHDPERLRDDKIGYCTEDYDEFYLYSDEKEDTNEFESVIRNINI